MTDGSPFAAIAPTEMPRDRISMTEHLREIEIGAYQSEHGVTQTVRFDVMVEVATRAEDAADNVDRILSYEAIVEAIDHALAERRLNLLETLAGAIAKRILSHPQALRCHVRIGKLDRGPFVLGVEITRDATPRPQVPQHEADRDAARSVAVFLSAEALARPDLPALLSGLDSLAAPVILCVDLPAGAVPAADASDAQRRIDLLAIEQCAWQLAACDPRCAVVASRSELDHARGQGRMPVLAPANMALTGAHTTGSGPVDPVGLAVSLAAALGARAVLQLGGGRRRYDSPDCPVTWQSPWTDPGALSLSPDA